MEFRPSEAWPDLFADARKSAFHMEVRDSYAVPEESEPLRRFLAGEPDSEDDDYDNDDWIERITTLAARGVKMSRIRVVSVPHSDYQRWLLSVTGDSVDAGEDIRYVVRDSVDPANIPADDWWLFDDAIVAFNLTDRHGRPVGPGITTDPGIVEYCRSARDRLWHFAVPYREHIEQTKDK
ncbi:DUF6879 family protein [Nocardia wallacei]|uniref:DUF6879 family protein n=1 Tax=Nocardia wallacei TaxID=480035 RepID=UPI002453C2E0|nr:DUF6879 family protein [Nocardia wallacei]